MQVSHVGLHIDVPFKGVLGKGECVEVGRFKNLGQPGFNAAGPSRFEPYDFGDEVALGLVLRQREGDVSDVRHGGAGAHVDQKGNVGGGAALK